jgi:hypothetical protein
VKQKIRTTIERADGPDDIEREFDVEVQFEYHRANRGARDSLCGVRGAGPALEPDEPAHIEIESVFSIETGKEVDLYDTERDRIEDECIEYVSEQRNRD